MTDNLPIELVYHADPLCGWCFAIAPALEEARDRIGDRAHWTLRMGGLVVGERVRPVGLDAAYLRSGLAQVAAATGRTAGDRYYSDIVDRGSWVSDSEPVCRAVLVAEELGGTDAAFTASHALSDALYLEGREPDAPATVSDLAASLGLEPEQFLARWASDTAAARLTRHWEQTRAMGLSTYPTVAAVHAGVVTPLVVGAASADDIVDAIEHRAAR